MAGRSAQANCFMLSSVVPSRRKPSIWVTSTAKMNSPKATQFICMELTEMVDILGSSSSRSAEWAAPFVRAGSRRRSPTASPMPGALTSPAWDEPGRPIGSRALDDITAFDEITR